MEGTDLRLDLFECLKAAGLQHHYARFTSVGVRSAAHLSRLTAEDYPVLGIDSAEDRTQLFQLVQVVQAIDLESEDDDDRDADAESLMTSDGCADPDEDEDDEGEDETGAKADRLSRALLVCKRLDFSCEGVDDREERPAPPVGTDRRANASRDGDNEPRRDGGSTRLDTGSTVWTREGINHHKPDAPSRRYDGRKRANTVPDAVSRDDTHNASSPQCVSPYAPKPKPERAAAQKFGHKLVGHNERKGVSGKEKLSRETIIHGASENTVPTMPVLQARRAAGYNYGLPRSSSAAAHKRQAPRRLRINVCVRKRPLTRAECERGEADVVTTPSGECVVIHEGKEAVDLTQYILQHRFYFDQVFGEESSNDEVYQRTAYPLVQHTLNGGKATCFAYGQTGAGKTHTMLGSSPRRPGLYALAAHDIFAHLSAKHTHSPSVVFVSFFEIYCGQLYDLLDYRKRLFAREDGRKVVHIAGLRSVRVDSVSSLLQVISQGTEERTQGTSGVNPHSSRSHALLQIQLRGVNQAAGKICFVDLAGSERACDTKDPDRQSRLEGAEINQSLLALKECIRSLDQEQSHTPFRQSKLTQILKDSFVGDSMTCMIANISPGHLTAEHTLNTLRYADRVKELGRQDGLKGGRGGKTIPSPKRNQLSDSSVGSKVCTRGKSPPKKAKLRKEREAFRPTTPASRLTTRGTILCSTAKNSRLGEETRARRRIGLEHITPIRGLLGIVDKKGWKESAGQGKDRRRETYGRNDCADHSICDQVIGAGVVPGQSIEQQRLWGGTQWKSVPDQREKENQRNTLRGGWEGERRWIEQRRQVEDSEEACSEVKRVKGTDLEKVDEREKERQRHLKRYHQQLQQFMPSSSDHPSFSLSNRFFFSPSVSESFVRHSSHISISDPMRHDLQKVLDGYRAEVEVRTDGNSGRLSSFRRAEISLQSETSPRCNRNTFEGVRGDSGDISEGWRVSLGGTEAGSEQDSGRSEKMRSQRATGDREGRARREVWRPAGMERRGERKSAFVSTTETEKTNGMKGSRPADVQPLMSNSCDPQVDKKGLDVSDVRPGVVWSTEEQVGVTDSYPLVSTYGNSGRNGTVSRPPVESPRQRAPVERPLSPAFTHTNTSATPNKLSHLSLTLKNTRLTTNILPLPSDNPRQGVSSSSLREREPLFAANITRRELAKAHLASQPLGAPILRNGCENPDHTQVHDHPEAKDKTSVLAQGETSKDSLGYIMDPLSISLLEVDQREARASFLQGELLSLCLPEMGECKREEPDKEFLKCSEIAGKAVVDEDAEFCLSLLAMPQAVVTRCPSTAGATIAANRACFATEGRCGTCTMTPPVPEVMLAPCTAHSNHSSNSSISIQPNSPAQSELGESTSHQQTRPMIRLSALEDFSHDQSRVIQAHWEHLEAMETCRKEGALLYRQPDMAFEEYVCTLGEIVERQASCVHRMIAQLQPYLKTSHSNQPHNRGMDSQDHMI